MMSGLLFLCGPSSLRLTVDLLIWCNDCYQLFLIRKQVVKKLEMLSYVQSFHCHDGKRYHELLFCHL